MRCALALALAFGLLASSASAQVVSERGFLEGGGVLFPPTATNDPTRQVGDALLREEVFLTPARWIRFAGGLDLRANSHDQVETGWRFDWDDRGVLRPRASLRRLTATVTAGPLTVDVGKQFIRWARADVLNPGDRFAPRDFVNVIDTDFLGVTAVRPSVHVHGETFEVVWAPRLTPSRMPLLDQRWTVLPPEAANVSIHDAGSRFPKRAEYGARYSHTGGRFEAALSYFDGFNHLPTLEVRPRETEAVVDLTRVFPRLRTYGADLAIPTGWFTLKAETAFFKSPTSSFDSYELYVVEAERQTGEWVLTAGYAGEVPTRAVAPLAFDPERGLTRSVIGRASYTVDPRRTVTIEGAARQNGDGQYVNGEYSQAIGQYWRLTLNGVVLAGRANDFLGRYRRNSYGSVAFRFSF